jgi:hypothetical protein
MDFTLRIIVNEKQKIRRRMIASLAVIITSFILSAAQPVNNAENNAVFTSGVNVSNELHLQAIPVPASAFIIPFLRNNIYSKCSVLSPPASSHPIPLRI